MQKTPIGFFAGLLLLMVSSSCGGNGCNKDGDADTAGPEGQQCQGPNIANAKYTCPKGYFCEYKSEEAMLNENELGTCRAMEQYKECKSITLCGSADFSPKCDTINETAYCDWLHTSVRCKCEGPGPFVEGDADGDLKTPTSTTPTSTPTTATPTTTQ